MKKFSMLFVTLTVVGILAVAALAGNSDKAQVGFSIEKYFSLEIKQGNSVDFGVVDDVSGSYTKKNGSHLKVESNTSWSLTTNKAVLQSPAEAEANTVLNALSVSLEKTEGKGNDNDIKVDYTLDNLENLPAGDYVIEVTFTGSAK